MSIAMNRIGDRNMDKVYEKDGYRLRLARKEDAEEYYRNNFKVHFL